MYTKSKNNLTKMAKGERILLKDFFQLTFDLREHLVSGLVMPYIKNKIKNVNATNSIIKSYRQMTIPKNLGRKFHTQTTSKGQ